MVQALYLRKLAEWFTNGLYDEHLRFVRSELKKRRDFMLLMLDKYLREITTWHEPTGDFIYGYI